MAAKNNEPTYEAIVRAVRQGQFAPVYYLMGEESYYIDKLSDFIVNAALGEEERDFNLMVFYGLDTTVDVVVNAARRYPVMAERQVVLVREANKLDGAVHMEQYLLHPQPSTILILCHKSDKLDKRLAAAARKSGVLFETPKIYENKLPAFVTDYVGRRHVAMDANAVMMMCDHVGTDLSRMASELDKLLVALPAGEKRITADFVERHVGVSKIFNNFELLDALVRKDSLKVARIVKFFNDNPKDYSVQPTLSMLFNFFSNLMVAYYAPDRSPSGLVGWLGVKPKMATDYYIPAMSRFSGVKVMMVINKIRETDVKSKGVGGGSASIGDLLTELTTFILY